MKPTITKEQADALLHLYSTGWSKSDVLEYHATGEWLEHCYSLNDLDILTLAAALVNGYEVEGTPEDRVREYFAELQEKERAAQSRGVTFSLECEREGVINTLNLLGIKIEGVNAR
ncbi:hypothetical protein [Bacillus velezensis]|uniref:hypothetical protein n=1 Tax=Bacillus velezensis TaxID=492670 RepID=UPI0009F288F7|nr:hypothetical protein [Bacillus velezensis]OQV53337.1 hypothetical protein B5Z20_03215 [Bacillus velezensis]OQV55360.1 hypothetical protein B5Z22_08080 [Bacillus velezensis]OQV60851.1 hypothetical protein B5Z24_08085 [Bacillus velezensis]OQV61918.1 hypothetical protein B5Z23_08070 [Bacillus velezensis]